MAQNSSGFALVLRFALVLGKAAGDEYDEN